MSDPTPIPPALTSSEWSISQWGRKGDGLWLQVSHGTPLLFMTSNDVPIAVRAYGEKLPAVIALANAARRDDDPGKLKQADVAMLRNVAGGYETPEGYVMTGRLLLALADKLAALLPPEAK